MSIENDAGGTSVPAEAAPKKKHESTKLKKTAPEKTKKRMSLDVREQPSSAIAVKKKKKQQQQQQQSGEDDHVRATTSAADELAAAATPRWDGDPAQRPLSGRAARRKKMKMMASGGDDHVQLTIPGVHLAYRACMRAYCKQLCLHRSARTHAHAHAMAFQSSRPPHFRYRVLKPKCCRVRQEVRRRRRSRWRRRRRRRQRRRAVTFRSLPAALDVLVIF